MVEPTKIIPAISRKISVFMLGFILVVVLFHSQFRYYYPFIEQLTAVSTSYFYCVSAFFFYRGLTAENIGVRLRRRCFTLLTPYLLWNLIYMILYCGSYEFTLLSILNRLTISPACLPSWYLLTLFFYLLPGELIRRICKNGYTAVALVCVGTVISYLGYIRFQGELAGIPVVGGYLVRTAEYFTPYLIGAVIGSRFADKLSVSLKRCVPGILCAGVMVAMLFVDIPMMARWLLWILLPLFLWQAVPECIFKNQGFVKFFTEPAFSINMMHCYFLFLWGKIMATLPLSDKYREALVVAVTCVSAYLVHYILKWLAPPVLTLLTGDRNRK